MLRERPHAMQVVGLVLAVLAAILISYPYDRAMVEPVSGGTGASTAATDQ